MLLSASMHKVTWLISNEILISSHYVIISHFAQSNKPVVHRGVTILRVFILLIWLSVTNHCSIFFPKTCKSVVLWESLLAGFCRYLPHDCPNSWRCAPFVQCVPSLVFPERTYYLCAKSGVEADEWIKILQWKMVSFSFLWLLCWQEVGRSYH